MVLQHDGVDSKSFGTNNKITSMSVNIVLIYFSTQNILWKTYSILIDNELLYLDVNFRENKDY